jgi:hypothetical protein
MAKKTTSDRQTRPGPESTVNQRVTYLLENVWNDNRSEMARDIGVTPSVLTKVAAGTQSAGRRLLAAIASHPKVNPAWVMSGEGEPVLAERSSAPTDGWPVPIARHLLPGSPDQHRDLLSGETFPLAGGLFRQSRYWLKMHPSEPITRHRWVAVRPDDLLLMETDRAFWTTEESVAERICAVKLEGEDRPKLGTVNWEPESPDGPSFLSVVMFDRQTDPSEFVEQFVINRYPNGKLDVARRQLPPVKANSKTGNVQRHASRGRFSQGLDPISLDDIAAVCVLLVRQ